MIHPLRRFPSVRRWTPPGFGDSWAEGRCGIDDRASVGRSIEKVEGGVENLALRLDVTGGSEWAPHRMRGEHDPRERHPLRDMSECFHHDHDRGRPRLLDCPRNVPDRHVAYRSDGDEEEGVRLLLREPIEPRREFPAEAPLRRCTREREDGVGDAGNSTV